MLFSGLKVDANRCVSIQLMRPCPVIKTSQPTKITFIHDMILFSCWSKLWNRVTIHVALTYHCFCDIATFIVVSFWTSLSMNMNVCLFLCTNSPWGTIVWGGACSAFPGFMVVMMSSLASPGWTKWGVGVGGCLVWLFNVRLLNFYQTLMFKLISLC